MFCSFYNFFIYYYYKLLFFFLRNYKVIFYIVWFYWSYYLNYQQYELCFCSHSKKTALTLISDLTGSSKKESRQIFSEAICKNYPNLWDLNSSNYSNSDHELFNLNVHLYNGLGFSHMTKCQNHFPTSITEITASLYLNNREEKSGAFYMPFPKTNPYSNFFINNYKQIENKLWILTGTKIDLYNVNSISDISKLKSNQDLKYYLIEKNIGTQVKFKKGSDNSLTPIRLNEKWLLDNQQLDIFVPKTKKVLLPRDFTNFNCNLSIHKLDHEITCFLYQKNNFYNFCESYEFNLKKQPWTSFGDVILSSNLDTSVKINEKKY